MAVGPRFVLILCPIFNPVLGHKRTNPTVELIEPRKCLINTAFWAKTAFGFVSFRPNVGLITTNYVVKVSQNM